jgi:membrane protein
MSDRERHADPYDFDGEGYGAARDEAYPGAGARRPREIPAAGWRQIIRRVWRGISADQVSLVGAGVAFFGLLAIFPGIAAIVSIYGLAADPASASSAVESMQAVPAAARDIVARQMRDVAATSSNALTLSLVVSVLLALWSASGGVKALMSAMNMAYREEETRGFFRRNFVALSLTLGAMIFMVLALTVIIGIPAMIAWIGLHPVVRALLVVLPWLVLVAVLMIGFATIYRFGPSRARAKFRWITPGAGVAAVVWVLASVGFSYYVSHFGSYNETYGSLGAVVSLLFWLYISALITILGAEIDAEIEQQAMHDTTTGAPLEMGSRGALVADAPPYA